MTDGRAEQRAREAVNAYDFGPEDIEAYRQLARDVLALHEDLKAERSEVDRLQGELMREDFTAYTNGLDHGRAKLEAAERVAATLRQALEPLVTQVRKTVHEWETGSTPMKDLADALAAYERAALAAAGGTETETA